MDMSGAIEGNYQSVSPMNQATGLWKKFFVHLAGTTNGAHKDFIKIFKGLSQTEVSSLEESDYLLVFCPITSRVGTDISEALDTIPVGKPAVLVVMHHTFNPNLVIAESGRHVNNPNVFFTVDFLFREGKLLKCDRNKLAWVQLVLFFGDSYRDMAKKGRFTIRG